MALILEVQIMYFEDFYVGQHFELSPIPITAAEIEEFARRYDPQPIHIDPVFAAGGLFQGVIASGLHTLSVVWGEWIRTGRFGTEIIGGTGLDFVRWTGPVRPGDTLYTDVEVTEANISPRRTRGLVSFKFTVRNQKDGTILTTQAQVYLKCRT